MRCGDPIRFSANEGSVRARHDTTGINIMLLRVACFAVLSAGCFAQSRSITIAHVEDAPPRQPSKLWIASCVALVAATSLDMSSSWGRNEANPILRSGDGHFGPKGATIKLAMAGAMIAPQFFVMKRAPRLQKAFAIANFVQAGLYTGVAVRNYGVSDRVAPGTPK